MNSIKIYLLSFLSILLCSSPLYSQNNSNNDKELDKKVEKVEIIDIYNIDGYTTEREYNKIHNINKNQNIDSAEALYEDEIYDDEKVRNRNRNSIAGEIVTEIFVDVFINLAFIIATCWH
jgi:hypothetical protein